MDDKRGLSSALSPDAAIRSTDTDALVSRVSAAATGYIQDSFSTLFLPKSQQRFPDKRPPLINIGTHARTWAIDILVEQFLSSSSSDTGSETKSPSNVEKQVISLGAGTDTRFWRLQRRYKDLKKDWPCKKWVEIDFEEATGSKARTVTSKASLKDALGGSVEVLKGGTALSSSLYCLLPGDLRSFSSIAEELKQPLGSRPPLSSEPMLDPSLPTLLLAECVHVYLPKSANEEILLWFTRTFASHATISFDPFGLDDSFGKVMIRNLATRNIHLFDVESTLTANSLVQRLFVAGFNSANCMTVKDIREKSINADELARISALERIDEIEELNLVLEHYAVTWGTSGIVLEGLAR